MNLLEIVDKHKANLSLKLKPSGDWCDFNVYFSFEGNKITIEIYDEEGGHYDSDSEPLKYEWVEQITNFVNDLKEAKAIPDYQLELPQ